MRRYHGFTEKDFQAVLNRHKAKAGGSPQGTSTRPVKADAQGIPSPRSTYRSKLESAWAQKLTLEHAAGVIDWWGYELLNMRLPGQKNFYKPDFLVMAYVSGHTTLTFYEIKGRNKSDDRSLVKMKTAAGLTPWARFILVKRVHGAWEERVIT